MASHLSFYGGESRVIEDHLPSVIVELDHSIRFCRSGEIAIERYLPGRRLEAIIGERFETQTQLLVPLPHPSGASRWLNDLDHRALLRRALGHVRSAWVEAGYDAAPVMVTDAQG